VRSRALAGTAALLCAAAGAMLPATPAQADETRDSQWYLRYLKVAEANKISNGAGITVAVIDTGVDPHPDLEKNLLPGTETFPGGTGDGKRDTDGHGTKVAGLIAAHGQVGGSGALGIAPKAKILPIRFSDRSDNTNPDEAVAKGIEWATAKGAQVISISLGGGASPRDVGAVRAALAADIVVVAAAGNQPESYGIGYPAALDGVVAVGATDRAGNRAKISVSGKQMAIVAPGVDIVGVAPGGKYSKGTGTSDSTAIVSGAVALIRSKYPNLSAQEVVHRLTATAIDKGAPGRDPEYGYGELDLVAALTADIPPLEPSTSASAPTRPSPTASAVAAPPERRSNNSTLTAVMVAVAALLAVGLVIALLLPRFRCRSGNRH
jgi:type VII secretion-associated serine protease mycosin